MIAICLVRQHTTYFTEIEIFSSPSLENVQHILEKLNIKLLGRASKRRKIIALGDNNKLIIYQAGGLEVRCWVVRLGDEQLGLGAGVDGGEHVTDLMCRYYNNSAITVLINLI